MTKASRDAKSLRSKALQRSAGEHHIPFTPFHFGPGILVKGFGLRWFWLTSFMAANVLIDVEVLYFLYQGELPLHRHLHTYVGGIGMGLLAGLIMFGVALILRRIITAHWTLIERLKSTSPSRLLWESVITGLLGGITHIFLDSLMHRDMHPWWPFAEGNALAGVIAVGTLHMGLAVSAFFGFVLWLLFREQE